MVLCHPLPLAAVLLMAVNDHWLKGSVVPSALTGKLSDIAGVFFFPVLLMAVFHGVAVLLRGRPIRWPHSPLVVVFVTGVGFALANLWQPFNRVLEAVWMTKVMDPSDLLALPCVVLSWLWMTRQHEKWIC